MKHEKGQVLVGFVLLLPLILMFLVYIIDNSLLLSAKTKLDEIAKSAIVYALENESSEEQIRTYIKKNEPDLDQIEIEINEEVRVKLTKTQKGVFASILGIETYTFSSSYQGKIENGEVVIRKQ